MKKLRRSLIRLALAIALLTIPYQDAAAQAEPLRLGFLTVRAGPQYGRDVPAAKFLE